MNANPSIRPLISISDYHIINQISKGGFANVFLFENTKTHEKFAGKVNFPRSNQSTLDQNKILSREIGILLGVHAPTIVSFYGFSLKDFEGQPNTTMIMEYKEKGSLYDLIKLRQAPPEYDNTLKQIILCGLPWNDDFTSRRVIHRDLKSGNVLLDSNYHPCISDFGLSKFLDPDNSYSQSMPMCGNLNQLHTWLQKFYKVIIMDPKPMFIHLVFLCMKS